MANKLRNPKEKLIAYFDNSGNNFWKTLAEISADTKIDTAIVGKTVTNSNDFVRASNRNNAGELLFTSRIKSRAQNMKIEKA